MRSLKDKAVLITGAGRGIGKRLALGFAAHGARVGLLARSKPELDLVNLEIEHAGGVALRIRADVRDLEQMTAAVERVKTHFGGVHVLICAAAIQGPIGPFLENPVKQWTETVETNLIGVMNSCRAVLPRMIERRSGAIVNIASVNGLTGLGEDAYSAAKAGVINLTQNMAVKYGRFKVRANVICPGTIQTPIWQTQLEKDPDIFERLTPWYPLGRIGQPEDIAKAALFLASDESAWITGVTLPVDGGLMAGSYRMARELEVAGPE